MQVGDRNFKSVKHLGSSSIPESAAFIIKLNGSINSLGQRYLYL